MSAQNYYVNFQNNTPQVYVFCVYQTIPNMQASNMQSVSWLQSTVPPNGTSGVSFALTYDALLANYSQAGGKGVYTASQTQPTALGQAWEVIYDSQYNIQRLQLSTTAPPPPADTISITNSSNILANSGIGMSGNGSVFTNSVYSGSTSYFQVTPTYFVGCYNNLVLGQVISSFVGVPTQQITYNAPYNAANCVLSVTGSTISLNVTYSTQTSISSLVKTPSTTVKASLSLQGLRDQSVLENIIKSRNFNFQAARQGLSVLNATSRNGAVHITMSAEGLSGQKNPQDALNKLIADNLPSGHRLHNDSYNNGDDFGDDNQPQWSTKQANRSATNGDSAVWGSGGNSSKARGMEVDQGDGQDDRTPQRRGRAARVEDDQ